MRDPDTWEEKIRQVPLLKCKVCGVTNRNHHYQRSNFWLVQRRVKPGVRRVKSMSAVRREKRKRRRRSV
jgi:hypothetical protein